MLAGVEHIVTPDGRPAEDEWVHKHVTSLVAAIYFFVTMRVRALVSGESADIDKDSYVPLRTEIIALVNDARQQVPARDADENVAWNGWQEVKPREFDAAVARVNEKEWLAADWYDGIVDVVNVTAKNDTDVPDDDVQDPGAPLPSRRADTMMQDRYDYLSEAKLAAYESWKAGILTRISQAVPHTTMDIDP